MKKYHIRHINGIDADESGTVTIAIPLQVLESIDEGNGVGYVIANRNPLNYGNVGLNAVDLSYSSNPSNIFGSTGTYSFTTGNNNTSSGHSSTSMGG